MTITELKQRQSWLLEQKIDHSLGVIEAFISRMGGVDKVYVSFSGGKDSTVLFHLARILYPNILGVFCNTGNEYPDIIRCVEKHKAEGAIIQTIRPKLTPKQVWEKYGFPLVSKQTSQRVHVVRYNPNTKTAQKYIQDGFFSINKRWRYLIDAPYETNDMCCDKLKKEPFHRFEKTTGRSPILGTMACESTNRMRCYVKQGGCNAFADKGVSKSMPLSIWTEQDVWEYISRNNIEIAGIYSKGLDRTGCFGCAFGAYKPDDIRFEVLMREYPKIYDMVMNYTNNGTSYREALRKMLSVTNQHLPDE